MDTLLFIVGFLGFIIAVGAFVWSFIKKNKALRKKALISGLLCLIMFFVGVAMTPTDENDSSVEATKTEQTSSTSKKENTKKTSTKKKVAASSKKKTTKSSSKEVKVSSSSKKKTTKTSSKKKATVKSSSKKTKSSSNSSSATETSSSVKAYDDAANAAFASELNTQINNVLSQSGVTDSFAVMPDGSNLIDVVVPQDYKYLPNSQIQQLADTILSAKENCFQEWNAKPENDYDQTYGPSLYIKSPDGVTLAKESFWGGTMKRVIDNN